MRNKHKKSYIINYPMLRTRMCVCVCVCVCECIDRVYLVEVPVV